MRGSYTDLAGGDEVFLEGLRFYAYHGVNPEERAQGQRFVVDVRIAANLREAGRTDDLTKTVDYSLVYRKVREIVEGEPRNLIETVADAIAAMILREFASAEAVTVTVRKPEVAIKGAFLDAAGVTVVRTRETRRRTTLTPDPSPFRGRGEPAQG
jgi:dihydroneopterin aldolase